MVSLISNSGLCGVPRVRFNHRARLCMLVGVMGLPSFPSSDGDTWAAGGQVTEAGAVRPPEPRPIRVEGAAIMDRSIARTEFEDDRLIHRFDFSERSLGNLESVPQYWEPLRPPGFPKFATGEFDEMVGHDAAPSFRLTSAGRNVAFAYTGPATPVRVNCDYRIKGFIRTEGTLHARACLSAYFLDQQGQVLLPTLVRSEWIGDWPHRDDWRSVELYLAAAPAQAAAIGLAAWVVQSDVWERNVLGPHYIPYVDVRACAWFDDISVLAIPRTTLTTSAPGNVLEPDEPQELIVSLSDPRGTGLRGRLTIGDRQGSVVLGREVMVDTRIPPIPERIQVGELEPGLYVAELEVVSGSELLVHRSLRFARVADLESSAGTENRAFGIVLPPQEPPYSEVDGDLLVKVAARSVKLPMWQFPGNQDHSLERRKSGDRFVHGLAQQGFSLTGILDVGSGEFGTSAADSKSLLEVFSGAPGAWQPSLADVVAPNSSLIHAWQIGPEARAVDDFDSKRLNQSVLQVRQALTPYVTAPILSGSVPGTVDPAGANLPYDQLTVAVTADQQSDEITDQLARWRSAGYERVSVFVTPLEAGAYESSARQADFAQRIICARHGGADTVYIPPPWSVRETTFGTVFEPLLEFLLVRTLADRLGQARPERRMELSTTAQCLSFRNSEEESTLACWDSGSQVNQEGFPVQLGGADRFVDYRGIVQVLERDGTGRQVLRLSPMPEIVPHVTRWLIGLRDALTLAPNRFEMGASKVRSELGLVNPAGHALIGRMVFRVPQGWDVRPGYLEFSVHPLRQVTRSLEFRFPHNEPAGDKTLVAELTLSDGTYLEVPLRVSVDLPDVDVWASAVVERGDLIIRHGVTNRTGELLHFRSSAVVPGRERQYRPIPNLGADQTETVEYRIPHGAGLIGSSLRVELRETDDGPRTHALELTVP